jgi:hypothetical protein
MAPPGISIRAPELDSSTLCSPATTATVVGEPIGLPDSALDISFVQEASALPNVKITTTRTSARCQILHSCLTRMSRCLRLPAPIRGFGRVALAGSESRLGVVRFSSSRSLQFKAGRLLLSWGSKIVRSLSAPVRTESLMVEGGDPCLPIALRGTSTHSVQEPVLEQTKPLGSNRLFSKDEKHSLTSSKASPQPSLF